MHTPDNPFITGCKDYERIGMCKNGKMNKQVTPASAYNFPNKNCCACGK